MDNPLLNIDFEVPFDKIQAEHVEPAIQRLIEQAQAALDQIAALSDPRTYENTVEALEHSTEALELVMTVVGHLESVVTTPELRAAYNKVKPDVSGFFASIPLNAKLYEALKDFANTDEARALTGPQKRFFEKSLREFKRHGAELDEEGKKKLEQISRALAERTAKYGQNVLDATAEYELIIEDEAKLSGLPESARAAAKVSAESKGQAGYRFTLQAPSLIPLLTYLDDGEIRARLYRAYNTRAAGGDRDNQAIALDILALRAQKAALLGYADFADLVTEERMAKTGASAKRFIKELAERTQAGFEAERDALMNFRRSIEGEDAPELQPWDVSYYSEKQRKALYDFDEEALRPYFAADRVLEGLFSTAQRLYGVTVKPAGIKVWHEQVKAYDLEDEQGERLGTFYVDLFPREQKRPGAWMNGLIAGVCRDGRSTPHLGLICANVTSPMKGKQALLTHNEVNTLFHEFGHLLHHLLSKVEVRSLAGTNVAWDFVELPSQIMENWCWEREALALFARHYETDAPIPDELFLPMKKARTYRAASAMMRQLGFATVDLMLHTEYDPARDGALIDYARRALQRFAPAPYPEDYAFICSFGHIFSSAVGYAAGYYSYKWAEVLDADAFTRFSKEGIFNREVGAAFRDNILARGDGDDPMKLYQSFMGREPKLEPLLERSGLPTG